MEGRVNAHAFLPLPGTPFAKRSPSPIPVELKALIGHLSMRGRLFGNWGEQEKIARRIILQAS